MEEKEEGRGVASFEHGATVCECTLLRYSAYAHKYAVNACVPDVHSGMCQTCYKLCQIQ